MRPLLAAFIVALLSPLASRAEDTRPPVISEVKAVQRGGQVVVEARITDETGVMMATCHHRSAGGRWIATPMTKDQYDDVFRVSFAAGRSVEYWIDSSDLLGNGPATYGAADKPLALTTEPVESAPPKRAEPPKHHPAKVASSAPPPTVEHQKPAGALPEGKEVTLHAKVRSAIPIAFSGVFVRKQGDSNAGTRVALTKVRGDEYEAKIPAESAHGTLEYLIAAKDENGKQTFGGDGAPTTWFTLTFKPAAQSFNVAVNPPARIVPGRSLTVRAQISTPGDSPVAAAKAQVVWRGADGQEQVTDMRPDPSGGLGGFKAELPPQAGGALYYQVIGCDASGAKCAISTGSKRKWHAVAIAAAPVAKPAALQVASSKGPSSLPE
ncbi:MAG TPA: hypothetical protein VE620_09570 [Myxococcales bacterium]|jgi:hypothetical protein|nr:hypothetical protein [Myxococcales bacterium]